MSGLEASPTKGDVEGCPRPIERVADHDLPPAKSVVASREAADVTGGDDDQTVRSEELGAAGEVCNGIVKVLEDVEHHDQVEAAIGFEASRECLRGTEARARGGSW